MRSQPAGFNASAHLRRLSERPDKSPCHQGRPRHVPGASGKAGHPGATAAACPA